MRPVTVCALIWEAILTITPIWLIFGIMKTTIDISDNLLNRAKEVARREKTTLKQLTEEGLHLVLARRGRGSARKVEPVVRPRVAWIRTCRDGQAPRRGQADRQKARRY